MYVLVQISVEESINLSLLLADKFFVCMYIELPRFSATIYLFIRINVETSPKLLV